MEGCFGVLIWAEAGALPCNCLFTSLKKLEGEKVVLCNFSCRIDWRHQFSRNLHF